MFYRQISDPFLCFEGWEQLDYLNGFWQLDGNGVYIAQDGDWNLYWNNADPDFEHWRIDYIGDNVSDQGDHCLCYLPAMSVFEDVRLCNGIWKCFDYDNNEWIYYPKASIYYDLCTIQGILECGSKVQLTSKTSFYDFGLYYYYVLVNQMENNTISFSFCDSDADSLYYLYLFYDDGDYYGTYYDTDSEACYDSDKSYYYTVLPVGQFILQLGGPGGLYDLEILCSKPPNTNYPTEYEYISNATS